MERLVRFTPVAGDELERHSAGGVVEFDDVINKQRETIYAERDKVLRNEDLTETVREFLDAEMEELADQYIGELKRYRAISMDVGDQDGLRVDAGKLHDVLDQYGVANTFEVYPGTHTSDVAVRFQEHVMPFFSRTLSFAPVKR